MRHAETERRETSSGQWEAKVKALRVGERPILFCRRQRNALRQVLNQDIIVAPSAEKEKASKKCNCVTVLLWAVCIVLSLAHGVLPAVMRVVRTPLDDEQRHYWGCTDQDKFAIVVYHVYGTLFMLWCVSAPGFVLLSLTVPRAVAPLAHRLLARSWSVIASFLHMHQTMCRLKEVFSKEKWSFTRDNGPLHLLELREPVNIKLFQVWRA